MFFRFEVLLVTGARFRGIKDSEQIQQQVINFMNGSIKLWHSRSGRLSPLILKLMRLEMSWRKLQRNLLTQSFSSARLETQFHWLLGLIDRIQKICSLFVVNYPLHYKHAKIKGLSIVASLSGSWDDSDSSQKILSLRPARPPGPGRGQRR